MMLLLRLLPTCAGPPPAAFFCSPLFSNESAGPGHQDRHEAHTIKTLQMDSTAVWTTQQQQHHGPFAKACDPQNSLAAATQIAAATGQQADNSLISSCQSGCADRLTPGCSILLGAFFVWSVCAIQLGNCI